MILVTLMENRAKKTRKGFQVSEKGAILFIHKRIYMSTPPPLPPQPPSGEFTSLEAALEHPEQAVGLDLRNQQLTYLDDRIGELVNLEVLHLGGNQLNDLPHELQRCQQLRTLILNKNKFTGVPFVVTALQNLESLSIAGNLLYMTPDDMSALFKLKQLNVSGNRLPSDEERKLMEALPHSNIMFKVGRDGMYRAGQPHSYTPGSKLAEKFAKEDGEKRRSWRIIIAIIALVLLLIRIMIRLG